MFSHIATGPSTHASKVVPEAVGHGEKIKLDADAYQKRTIAEAQGAAYGLLKKIWIPNQRYRIDIGNRYVSNEGALLRKLGWL